MSQTPWWSPDEGPPPEPSRQPPQVPPPGWGAAPPPGWGAPPPSGWGAAPPPGWGGPAAPPPGQWSDNGPGIVPLRPLSVYDIYDGAIRAVRFNPRTMVGFSALVIAVVTLILTVPQAALSPLLSSNAVLSGTDQITADDVAGLISGLSLSVLLPSLTYLVVTTVITALLITAVDAAVRGHKLTPGELWKVCRGRLLAVLGLALINLALVVVGGLVLLSPGIVLLIVLDSPIAGVLVLILGVLVAIPLSIAVLLGWLALAAPALLLERLSVFAALRRSARLIRGSFWRVVGIGLLTAILTSFLSGIVAVPFAAIGYGVTAVMHSSAFVESLVSTAAGNVGTVIAGAIVYPFSAAVSALLYLDLRMRREGLDVQLMSGR